MSKSKKLFLLLFIILFLLSILHDLSNDTAPLNANIQLNESEFEIITVKVMPGDTVFSIIEEMNDFQAINANKIIDDFQRLNPDSNYQSLDVNQYYYFPLYNE